MTNKLNSKKTIVIVDDDDDLLSILRFVLQNELFKVITFSNGSDAIEHFQNTDFLSQCSLIILDRVLKDLDGLEIAKIIGKQKHKPPIIFLSVLSTENEIQKGIEMGATMYICKPFNIKIFLDLVKKTISS
ncbi:MAG: response regulator [Chlamydiae bacterium]|nr:response regulator [Chlamydiota bacterium]